MDCGCLYDSSSRYFDGVEADFSENLHAHMVVTIARQSLLTPVMVSYFNTRIAREF